MIKKSMSNEEIKRVLLNTRRLIEEVMQKSKGRNKGKLVEGGKVKVIEDIGNDLKESAVDERKLIKEVLKYLETYLLQLEGFAEYWDDVRVKVVNKLVREFKGRDVKDLAVDEYVRIRKYIFDFLPILEKANRELDLFYVSHLILVGNTKHRALLHDIVDLIGYTYKDIMDKASDIRPRRKGKDLNEVSDAIFDLLSKSIDHAVSNALDTMEAVEKLKRIFRDIESLSGLDEDSKRNIFELFATVKGLADSLYTNVGSVNRKINYLNMISDSAVSESKGEVIEVKTDLSLDNHKFMEDPDVVDYIDYF